jgi:hypothetical protein
MSARRPDVVTVAVTRVDGGLTILRVITTEYRPADPDEQAAGLTRVAVWTIDPTPEYVDAIIAKHDWQGGQAPVSWRFVPDDIVDDDTDQTFRNAWRDGGGNKPDVDMVKARDIHRNRLRRMRAPLLEDLDAEYMQADEAGDQQAKRAIAARKQALRDVTSDAAIDAAMTPEALKAVIPDALKS